MKSDKKTSTNAAGGQRQGKALLQNELQENQKHSFALVIPSPKKCNVVINKMSFNREVGEHSRARKIVSDDFIESESQNGPGWNGPQES